jgi:hypothetical protein
MPLMTFRAPSGYFWQSRQRVTCRKMFIRRVIANARRSPSSLVSRALSLSRPGTGRT